MKAIELARVANVAVSNCVIGLERVDRTLEVSLPLDYLDILSTFGVGDFGGLCLFHPDANDLELRLPDGCFLSSELLAPFNFPAPSLVEGIVLGRLGGRKFLVYRNGDGWSFFDSEDECYEQIGPNLVEFLHHSYFGLDSDKQKWGEIIWGEPFPVLPFFEKRA